MQDVNCSIKLHYFPQSDPGQQFHFDCSSSSRSWSVHHDGTIFPPARTRIVQFEIGFPKSSIAFAGFQVSPKKPFPEEEPAWMPRSELEAFGISIVSPSQYPPPEVDGVSQTTEPLVVNFGQQQTMLFYRLAIVGQGSAVLHWDDPRIYNDGSQ